MRVLHSKNKLEGFNPLILSLEEVHWELDEAALKDRKFRAALSLSLEQKGMLWPPIVWTQDTFMKYLESGGKHDYEKSMKTDKELRVAIGNNRFDFAKKNNYTHIECVLAQKPEDRLKILEITKMDYCVDF